MIHCCFTSLQEVMFRCPQDVGFFLNLLALTSWKYGVDIFADTEMSNHVHLLLFSSDKTENRLSVGPYSKTVTKPGFDRDGSILYSIQLFNRILHFGCTIRTIQIRQLEFFLHFSSSLRSVDMSYSVI